MAGLDPAIHVLLAASLKNVDARDKPGHDEISEARSNQPYFIATAGSMNFLTTKLL
jgi:hypothetical protein